MSAVVEQPQCKCDPDSVSHEEGCALIRPGVCEVCDGRCRVCAEGRGRDDSCLHCIGGLSDILKERIRELETELAKTKRLLAANLLMVEEYSAGQWKAETELTEVRGLAEKYGRDLDRCAQAVVEHFNAGKKREDIIFELLKGHDALSHDTDRESKKCRKCQIRAELAKEAK